VTSTRITSSTTCLDITKYIADDILKIDIDGKLGGDFDDIHDRRLSMLVHIIQEVYEEYVQDIETTTLELNQKLEHLTNLSKLLLILCEYDLDMNLGIDIDDYEYNSDIADYMILKSIIMIGDLLLHRGVLEGLQGEWTYERSPIAKVPDSHEAMQNNLEKLHETILTTYSAFLKSISKEITFWSNYQDIEGSYFFKTLDEYLDIAIDIPDSQKFERRYDTMFRESMDFGGYAGIYKISRPKLIRLTAVNSAMKRLLSTIFSVDRVRDRYFSDYLSHLIEIGDGLIEVEEKWDSESWAWEEISPYFAYEVSLFLGLMISSLPFSTDNFYEFHRKIRTLESRIFNYGRNEFTNIPLLVSGNVYEIASHFSGSTHHQNYGSGYNENNRNNVSRENVPAYLNHEINLQKGVITNQLNRFLESANQVLLNLNQWMHDIDPDSGLGIIGPKDNHSKRREAHVCFYRSLGVSMNLHGNGPGRRIEAMFSHPNKKSRDKIISEIERLPTILSHTMLALSDFPLFRHKLRVLSLVDVFLQLTRCSKSAGYFEINEVIQDMDVYMSAWLLPRLGRAREEELYEHIDRIVALITEDSPDTFVENYDAEKIISIQNGLKEIYFDGLGSSLSMPSLLQPPEMISPIELDLIANLGLLDF